MELHWALVDQESLLPSVGIDSPNQDIAVAGGTLRTLATTELFAYLCVHGAIHCWSRLKWLADLRALLGEQTADELERLHRHAADLGAARSAGVALVLCHDLLGLRLRDAFLTELRRDRAVRALSRNALLCLSYRDSAREHERLTRPWWRTIAAQFFLAPGLKHGLARVPFFWNPPIDRLKTPLPPGMGFLYPFLRLPLWLGRVGKSMFQGTK